MITSKKMNFLDYATNGDYKMYIRINDETEIARSHLSVGSSSASARLFILGESSLASQRSCEKCDT